MTQERRTADRNRTFLGGWIVFNNRNSTLDCVVRNISETGALLLLDEPFCAPSKMQLSIRQTGETRAARVVWRGERGIGVVFTQANSDNVVPIAPVRRTRAIEAMRAAAAQRGHGPATSA